MQREISSKKRNHFEFQRKFPKGPETQETQSALRNGFLFRGAGLRLAHQCKAWDPEFGHFSTGNAQKTQNPPEKETVGVANRRQQQLLHTCPLPRQESMGTDAAKPNSPDNPKLHLQRKPSVTGNCNFHHRPQRGQRGCFISTWEKGEGRWLCTHTWTIAALPSTHVLSQGDGAAGDHEHIIMSIVT